VVGHDVFASAGDDPSFFELGMDSLMSLDLRNRLQRELDCNLRSTVAFEYPAVRELADYLISAVLPAGMFA
jgi:acyl carrier protein